MMLPMLTAGTPTWIFLSLCEKSGDGKSNKETPIARGNSVLRRIISDPPDHKSMCPDIFPSSESCQLFGLIDKRCRFELLEPRETANHVAQPATCKLACFLPQDAAHPP